MVRRSIQVVSASLSVPRCNRVALAKSLFLVLSRSVDDLAAPPPCWLSEMLPGVLSLTTSQWIRLQMEVLSSVSLLRGPLRSASSKRKPVSTSHLQRQCSCAWRCPPQDERAKRFLKLASCLARCSHASHTCVI